DGIAINHESFKSLDYAELTSTTRVVLQHSLLAAGAWYKFFINEDGMYKITGSSLLSAGLPASTNPMSIKLYNNGGIELPETVTAPYLDDLHEVRIYTFDGGTSNQLDAGDYIIFYGKGVRGWTYAPASKSFSHYINHFTESNVYWLTFDGALSQQMSPLAFESQPATYQPATVGGKLYREDEKINVVNSGLEWLGQQFNTGEGFTYVHPLPGLDASQPIGYKFIVGAQAKSTSTFRLYEHSSLIFTTGVIGATDIARYGLYFVGTSPRVSSVSIPPNFSDGQSQLRFVFSSNDPNGYGYLNWYELFYKQFPRAQGNVFTFHAHDTSAITEYRVPGFSTNEVFVFDVSQYDSVLINTQPTLSVDTCSITLQLTAGKARELYLTGTNSFRTVEQFTPVANQDLHGDTTTAEEIIITSGGLMPAALRLKAHRERPGDDYTGTRVVDIETIYNEFGGGLPNPRAVRNYLKYSYTNRTAPPKYLLMFGDGDFDYRGILSQRNNKIPVWETGIEFDPIHSYATDDDFVIFNTSYRVAMGVGRIPAQTLAEANTAVDKIIEYELYSVHDPWKLLVTLVADDGLAGADNDRIRHATDAEIVASHVPQLFETKKIFLHEYPAVFSANGRRKPSVNEAIRNQINLGTAVLNYSGHGNPRLWAHEQVFVRETDFSLLSNKGKYFFLVAATCNYSAMDMLNEQSSGELLMMLPNAGAIATYSATRPVYSIPNRDLNEELYDNLFAKNSSGQIIPRKLGEIIYKTRQKKVLSDNDRKYVLLGDPAIRITIPRLYGTIDSINSLPMTQTAQLQALSNSEVVGSIRDSSAILLPEYAGTAQLIVYDADRTVQVTTEAEGSFSYRVSGNVIFRGAAQVESGKVTTRFIVPKDISYTNDSGRITMYFSNGTTDGAGYTTNIIIGGTDSTAENDTEGPAIRLYLDHRTFRSGDVATASPLLIADLEDEHGINTSGAGVGHRIEAWLDNSSQSNDLTPYYKSNLNTYQQGTVEYTFTGLTPGNHKLRMRAWDTYNNSSQSEIVFDVVSAVGLQLTSVFNYPNPFASSTIFSIEHNQIGSVDAEIKVYTVAGRLIQTLESRNANTQIINISWDGRDRDGDEIANGIYLYKAVVKTSDRRLTGEAFGKLSVLK
ncbi:MAG: type IX secretion system sortase PorU, partial [Bacteroidetes bacterium]